MGGSALTGKSFDLVVVGSTNLDTSLRVQTLPRPGETVIAVESFIGLGGKGANQAVAAALAGATTAFIGCVGSDDVGSSVRGMLEKAAVDSTYLATHSTLPTGRAFIAVDAAGENSIIVDPGANHGLGARDAVKALETLLEENGPTRPVVLMQGELRGAVVDAVVALARRANLRFVLNLAPPVPVAKETLAACDPLVLNEGEAQLLAAELLSPDVSSVATGEFAIALARNLGTSIVVTTGKDGALVVEGARHWRQPAPETSHVVDTTGAGDAFTAVLASALSAGDSLEQAVRLAVAAGSHAVTGSGAASSFIDQATLAQAVDSVPAAVEILDQPVLR
jgi:ribokinase